MTFKMWSWFHILYIFAPLLAAAGLFFIFKNKTQKTKWIAALVLAVINMVILITRNIDIAIRNGMNAEIIPLGPCHFANIIFLIAVLTKKQSWYNLAWCLNLPFGFLAVIFANSLANYSTLLAIRPMAYLWGHFFLVVSVLYVFLTGLTELNKKSFKTALIFSAAWAALCIVVSISYNLLTKGNNGFANYMYFLLPEGGTPMDIIYNLIPQITLGNMKIDILYIFLLICVGFVVFLLFHILHQAGKKVLISIETKEKVDKPL